MNTGRLESRIATSESDPLRKSLVHRSVIPDIYIKGRELGVAENIRRDRSNRSEGKTFLLRRQ
jgi:hypothetical protein